MGEYSGSTHQTSVGVRVAIVASRFNEDIVHQLVESAEAVYHERGGADHWLTTVWVPGAFELPMAARWLAERENAADLKGGYQVIATDVNKDGKLDLVALA